MWKRRGTYKDLMGKPEGKSPFGSPRRRCEGNMKISLQEIGWGSSNGLICLGIKTSGKLFLYGNELCGCIKCGAFLD
jgi:hypothetical protein